jgi:hypothetical protein
MGRDGVRGCKLRLRRNRGCQRFVKAAAAKDYKTLELNASYS